MLQRAKEFGGDVRVSDATPETLVEVRIPFGVDLRAAISAQNQATA